MTASHGYSLCFARGRGKRVARLRPDVAAPVSPASARGSHLTAPAKRYTLQSAQHMRRGMHAHTHTPLCMYSVLWCTCMCIHTWIAVGLLKGERDVAPCVKSVRSLSDGSSDRSFMDYRLSL